MAPSGQVKIAFPQALLPKFVPKFVHGACEHHVQITKQTTTNFKVKWRNDPPHFASIFRQKTSGRRKREQLNWECNWLPRWVELHEIWGLLDGCFRSGTRFPTLSSPGQVRQSPVQDIACTYFCLGWASWFDDTDPGSGFLEQYVAINQNPTNTLTCVFVFLSWDFDTRSKCGDRNFSIFHFSTQHWCLANAYKLTQGH